VPRRLAHEAKAGEVTRLALGSLILFGAGEVITGEVEVTEGCTCSRHHLLKLLLLLLVPEVVLLLALALVTGVIPVVVVILVGGVELLSLGAIGDEVGGAAALEAAPRRHPLLAESVQRAKLPHQHSDLIVGDALVLLIRSYAQGRQSKL
jgi:type IV secretory pathway TrbL component